MLAFHDRSDADANDPDAGRIIDKLPYLCYICCAQYRGGLVRKKLKKFACNLIYALTIAAMLGAAGWIVVDGIQDQHTRTGAP